MPEFVPIDRGRTPEITGGKSTETSTSEVQKAKDAAEIQKYETQRIEEKRKAVLAESDIKDAGDLKTRLLAVAEKETQLARDFMAFDNRKATELSEVQKLKAEQERKLAELTKREQDMTARIQNVAIREKLVEEREELMNETEKQHLEALEKQQSLVEQLKRGFPRIKNIMADNADILIQAGFTDFGYDLLDELDELVRWSKNDIGKHCQKIVASLRDAVEDCNQQAVAMARNPKAYDQRMWDGIVDNLEVVYKLLPVLRPPDLPSDTEGGLD